MMRNSTVSERRRTGTRGSRVNALVGLSVHFSYTRQLFEELDMARAATRSSRA